MSGTASNESENRADLADGRNAGVVDKRVLVAGAGTVSGGRMKGSSVVTSSSAEGTRRPSTGPAATDPSRCRELRRTHRSSPDTCPASPSARCRTGAVQHTIPISTTLRQRRCHGVDWGGRRRPP